MEREEQHIGTRTFDSLQTYLLDQIGNIPTESNPRGGNALRF